MNDELKKRAGLTLIEGVLILAIVVLAVATIMPAVHKTRDAVAVEIAARNLQMVESAVDYLFKAKRDEAFTEADITYEMIVTALRDHGHTLAEWPKEADLETLLFTSPDGPTVTLNLKCGERIVTVDDVTSPR